MEPAAGTVSTSNFYLVNFKLEQNLAYACVR